MDLRERIEAFLAAGPYAVAGASNERAKYGNKVLRAYREHGLGPLYPVNPNAAEVEGLPCHPDVVSTPEPPRSVSVVTPPHVTERIVEDAARAGARHVWMQPGAESAAAVRRAEELGLSVIAGGPCLLVELGRRGGSRSAP